jgi:Ca-activated chloride channel family protein
MKRWVEMLVSVLWTLLLLTISFYVVWWWIERVYEVPFEWGSFRFERPWAGLLLPAGLLVWIARSWILRDALPRLRVSRGADLAKVARPTLRQWIAPFATAARVVAVTLLALALMGPQSIRARDDSEVQGIDIVLALDVSLSMQASDILPNRFEAMKSVVDEFVQRRPNDRIGAVVFGRDAYTLLPLTTDKEALRGMIAELELDMIDGRGTAIGNALGVSLNRLRHSTAASRVIILLTDGDSNSGNVSPEQAAEFAHNMNVRVYTVLMGQSDQASVQQGTDIFGRPVMGRGEFPINPQLMQHIADETGGQAFVVGDRQSLERSFHSILDSLERSVIEDQGRVYGELFPAFTWPALALLTLELILSALWLRRFP